jgi:hypothetical protein
VAAVTATSPSRSVRNVRIPLSPSAPTVDGAGWPYGLPSPALTSAAAAPVASRNSAVCRAEPWCGTLRTSARPGAPRARSASWAGSSTSPVSSAVRPGSVARRTSELLLGSEPVPWNARSGPSTSNAASPTLHRSPRAATRTGTPRSAAQPSTRTRSSGGSSSGPTTTSPGRVPRRTPGRPSTWSAWKCVSTTAATRRTRRSRRQRSAASGSGPVSTTTAPADVRTTSASPCPTSHATSRQPGGGQEGATYVVTAAATTAAAVAVPTARRPARRARSAAAVSSSASVTNAPVTPVGTPRVAAGSVAPYRATRTSQPTGIPASQATPRASGGETGATAAAVKPASVAGATAGAAATLAGTATTLTVPNAAASSGAHAACAASGVATASASQPGRRRWRRTRHGGARRSRPAVAQVDSAKPSDVASAGSSRTRNSTAPARKRRAARSRPVTVPASPNAPMVAARSTDGDGRASSTKNASPRPPSTAAVRGPTPQRRATRRTAASRMATFWPDTATRWVRPVRRKSSRTAGSRRVVSPTTRPGSRPRASGGSTSDASRRPARRWPAIRLGSGAAARRTGSPNGSNDGPDSDERRRPVTRRRSPGRRSLQPGPRAKTTNERRRRSAVAPRTRRSARTSANVVSAMRCAPTTRPVSGRGSPVTVRSRVTTARSAARAVSGPSRVAARAVVAMTPASAQASAAAATGTACRRAGRTQPTTTPPSTATSATAASGWEVATAAASHAARAGSTRRRSVRAAAFTRSPAPGSTRTCARRSR